MALKKDGERITITLSVKKKTADALKALSDSRNRTRGRMVDEIIANYEQYEKISTRYNNLTIT